MKISINQYYPVIILALASLFLQACTDGQKKAASSDNSRVVSDKNTQPNSSGDGLRIISLSGYLTEILSTLGYEENIVGRDVTSTYPASIEEVPAVGRVSTLNAEALLALKPDIIVIEKGQLGEARAVQQLKGSGIKILAAPKSNHFASAIHTADYLSSYLDISDTEYEAMKEKIIADSIKLNKLLKDYDTRPSVLFIYAMGASRLLVGGAETPVAAMIEKAGGKNAISSFDNYRQLTPEALIEASPEVILMFNMGLKSLHGREGLSQIPGIQQTVAYKEDKIVTMNGHYLSSFGPRAAEAAIKLSKAIH